MKYIASLIAVLATAALMVANSFAADSYSPPSTSNKLNVSVDATTHVQVIPASYSLLQGYNIYTNGVSTTGTNFIISPIAPRQFISASNDLNFVRLTNNASGTSWKTEIVVNPNGSARALTVPATWNWATNTAQPKLTSIASGTFGVYEIESVDTNVFIIGRTFKP